MGLRHSFACPHGYYFVFLSYVVESHFNQAFDFFGLFDNSDFELVASRLKQGQLNIDVYRALKLGVVLV